MSVLAGVVFAELGGKFNPSGFVKFGTAMRTAQGQMEASEKRMKTSAQRTSASLHALGHAAKVGAGAGIIGLGAIIAGSVKKAADFEAQLSSLGAVSNATGKQMQSLRKQAMDAGAATKFSALEAAQAQAELAKGGLSVTKILSGGLKGALALAAAGEMDLADAASTTANALNLFKLNGSQATHVADAMATAANATTADVSDFALALTQGGAAAKAAGLSFDQTMVALEALASSGVKGSDAGTSLKAALTQLASPTKKASDLTKELGLNFFDAHGVMKSMPQVAAMLNDKLGGLTKQQRLQAATTLVGTDGMRALLALYDTGGPTLTRFGDGLAKQGTAAETAAEKQDNLKGRLENLKGSIETAGIALGTKLLPMLERLAVKGTEWVNHLVESGQIDRFAHGVEDAFRTMGTVISDFAAIGRPVISFFIDLAGALNLSDATTIEAIVVAIGGFKVVSTVLPMIQTLGAGLRTLFEAAATAPSLGALLSDIGLGPIGAVALAVSGLAAAFVLLGDNEDIEAQIARENSDAHRDQAEAIKSVMDAERSAADKGLAAKQAALDLERAHNTTAEALKRYGRNSLEYRQALNSEHQAVLRNYAATRDYKDSLGTQLTSNIFRTKNALDNLSKARKTLTGLEAYAQQRERSGANVRSDPEYQQQRANAMANVVRRTQEYVQAVARAQVSDLSRNRLMEAANQITEKNAVGIARLVATMGKVPGKVQSRVLLEDQAALGKIGDLIGRLKGVDRQRTVAKILTTADNAASQVLAFRAVVAGVPASKVFRILHNAPNARAEVDRLRASIDSLHDKKVTITTREVRIGASGGRGFGGGAAAGAKTTGPQMYLVGEGTDPVEWIIPRDPKYRGRALGLLMDAAKSILPGAAKGAKHDPNKGAHYRMNRYVPSHLDPLGLPVDDFEARMRSAQSELQKVRTTLQSVPGEISTTRASIRDIERRDPDTDAQKRNKADDLRRANAKLKRLLNEQGAAKAAEPKRKADLAQRRKELADARAYAAKIAKQTELADIAADQMRLADARDNQAGYDSAKAKRITALKRWRDLLIDAQKHVPRGTPYWRELRKALGQARLDLQETATATSEASQEEPGTYTTAEQARLDELGADAALATLTAETADDIAAATGLESFLTGVLADARANPAAHGGNAGIAEIANAVKSARDNLYSLTHPDKTADVQAQLEQAHARIAALTEGSRAQAALLTTLTGPGDIGAGRGGGTAGQTFVIQTLHPGDPATLRAIGDAAVGGISLQPSQGSPRQSLGV